MIFDERIAGFSRKLKYRGELPPKSRQLLEDIVPCCETNAYSEVAKVLDENGICADIQERAEDFIVDEVIEYVLAPAPKSTSEFDAWHFEACVKIMDFLKGAGDTDDNALGLVQYWLNLTIKYLYLFVEDFRVTDDSMDYFRYSHVPISSVILTWYGVKVGALMSVNKFSWGNYDAYLAVQNTLRKHFTFPIAEEYKIWWDYNRKKRFLGSLMR